jgi:3'-phosphoadenosine 5'-phosphosulfate sulfotransferase (PAPS reductase)/FAD synthetase
MVTHERRYGVLENDYEPGNYIAGSIYENRIDWDAIEEMENHAMGLMEEWSEKFDRVMCCFSGGIDSLVPLHMAYRVGFDGGLGDVLNAKTPQEYPSNQEYIEGMCDRWGFDMYFWESTDYDIDVLTDDPDKWVFPRYDEHMKMGDQRQRSMHKWNPDEHDMRVYGRRIQHNSMSISHCDRRNNVWQGNPIRNWKWEHVLAYCDKYELPISPGYRQDWPYGIGEQWFRRFRTDHSGDDYESVPQCWWTVREYCINWGYTDFWKYLVSHFDGAEDMAVSYALENNRQHTDVENGYDRGCDANPNPPIVGPDADKHDETKSFRETDTETGKAIYSHLNSETWGEISPESEV